ncbi:S8 family serine peptidase [Microbacterium sp. NPDC057407]|uniref:S8 family serine peptidase n=1 Tax=Microbacterium sp. NPDC057407 TaxID=3346120 RepID=UPI0036733F2B
MNRPIPIDLPAGRYIVVLDEAPVATYDGGEPGLAPTKPDEGAKLDANSTESKKYSRFLQDRQTDVAADAGVTPDGNLTVTLNAFTANLTARQAAKLAGTKGVQSVVPDEILHPDAVPSTEFLGLEGETGVWNAVGGIEAAGAGTVVGVIDTGIAPENPSFAGEPLGTSAGAEPYLDGNTVTFAKADGNTFRSARVTGQQWNNDDYSTKLIGAKYFSAGAAAAGYDFSSDHLSPRDADGHGSHTASTAAGNHGIEASVEGVGFGQISGVAPAAKVAAYKACYVGPDELLTTDDICALSDLMSAINAAAADGVDVINYSIGGGAATSTFTIEDAAFFNAAAAGIFVAVSAGNDGPDASTADHASPWYTTVAASTIPTYEGTVQLPNGFEEAGASVSVPFGESITAPVVYAGDVALAGASTDEAALCYLDRLDPAKVDGKIVVCDRGGNARVEKSQAVGEAGGVGMILVNVTAGSLDNDFHSVPTVHLDAQYRDALLDYVQNTADATATLVGENTTVEETPTPVVAGFSSRGPMLADGSDILKPDISAPGVAILAAEHNAEGADPIFGFKSGTSMSSPHIAGLAALYLGERPLATPAEIKSAMMTTAYDTVDGEGQPVTDPFAQGAGHVDPTRFFEAGLVYDNGPLEWLQYLQGKNLYDEGVTPIDGSDLNLASIAIGALSGPQTVTREVRATTAGTYTASVSVPGLDAVVEPASITLAEGEKATFTVTFTKTTADVEQWTTGFLTWTGPTTVRSPIAVYPVTADAPADVAGKGISGSTEVTITPGVSGELPLNLSGLAPAVLQTEPLFPNGDPVPGHTGNQNTGDEDGYSYYLVDVPESSKMARFDLASSDDEGSDLDLFVYRVISADDLRYYETWSSATESADESVVLDDPTAGTYLVETNVYSYTDPFVWNLTTAVVGTGGEGSLTATPNPLAVTEATPTGYTLSWTGLAPKKRYYGVVQYGDSDVRTILTVNSGAAAPVATTAPKITGTAKVGNTLTASPGTWKPSKVTFAYQWLRDGSPISGATKSTYKVAKADLGTKLTVRVTATQAGNVNTGTATSAPVRVKYPSNTVAIMNRYVGPTNYTYKVAVTVTPSGGAPATGTVTVLVDSKKYTGKLVNGAVTVTLPKQARGVHLVSVSYSGSSTVWSSSQLTVFLVR